MEKICLIFVSFIFVVASFAQTSLSIRTGVNVANTNNLYAFTKNRAGLYGGVTAQIPVHKRLSFQSELIYSSKGDRVNRTYDIGGYKSNRFNYLNMPFLLNYRFDKKTAFLIGPEFGYLLSVKAVLIGGTAINFTKQYLPKFDLAASIGVQYHIINNISIETRYNYGFNRIYYVDFSGMRHTETKGANRVFQIGIKYLFFKQKN
jgi:opacity protein-like surface antigen